jgi:hypothetical protein
MFEEVVTQALTQYPWASRGLLILAMVQFGCRMVAEICFTLAANMGDVQDSPLAVKIGKVAWFTGKVVGAFGFGVSKKFISAQYVEKEPKQ